MISFYSFQPAQVTGIAVCNEPSRLIPAEILASFYDEAVGGGWKGRSSLLGKTSCISWKFWTLLAKAVDVVRAAGMTDRVPSHVVKLSSFSQFT